MLFYLILLTLTFVCPIVSVLILVALWIKYWQFIRATGIQAGAVDFDNLKRKQGLIYQLVCLVVESLIMALIPFSQGLKALFLAVLIVVALLLLIQTLIATYREHVNVDVQAIENDNDIDADTVRIFIEKRSLSFYALTVTIALVNVGILLNLL
ncbi:hypothetical protein [Lactobacillus sp. Sy-1]|uniref:hypothetical protein n=1 Tax=Lactobacillus sp. Sy-1 TaxID=2109645 RepID=UPI001C568BAC|nr:hypothetical protein [Lactobacillus sp. Sy-1]MBW1604934.1 hypothetical protein [Lactobacillus sp. Sy-1]